VLFFFNPSVLFWRNRALENPFLFPRSPWGHSFIIIFPVFPPPFRVSTFSVPQIALLRCESDFPPLSSQQVRAHDKWFLATRRGLFALRANCLMFTPCEVPGFLVCPFGVDAPPMRALLSRSTSPSARLPLNDKGATTVFFFYLSFSVPDIRTLFSRQPRDSLPLVPMSPSTMASDLELAMETPAAPSPHFETTRSFPIRDFFFCCRGSQGAAS